MFDIPTLTTLCSPSAIHTRGPLNNTYSIEFQGQPLFVRERLISSLDYGQSFAAERHLTSEVRARFHVPALLAVVEDAGRERYAVFEYIDGHIPDWNDPVMRIQLQDTLVDLHVHKGPGFGDLGNSLKTMAAGAYIRQLIERELAPLRGDLSRSESTVIDEALFASDLLFDFEPPTLCHGDVHANNFMVDKDGRFCVIDWEAVRFRVAASDFNQMHYRWLAPREACALVKGYCDARSLDVTTFEKQVRVVRMLWDLRTYNFRVRVLKESPTRYQDHLESAIEHAQALGWE